MTRLIKSALLDDSRQLFAVLEKSPELEELTLVGGTALALQINHRVSLDFDFAAFDEILPTRNIDALINRLRAGKNHVNEITDTNAVSQFKINTGENLRDYARDYVMNNIKVTFFTLGKNQNQRQFYKDTAKVKDPGATFSVLGMDGLKTAKTLVLADRVRSRDLFDLMILVKDYSFTLDQMNLIVKQIGHIDDMEHYRAVMTGVIPLDNKDEGLNPVNVTVKIEDIYLFFEDLFAEHDVETAAEFYSEKF